MMNILMVVVVVVALVLFLLLLLLTTTQAGRSSAASTPAAVTTMTAVSQVSTLPVLMSVPNARYSARATRARTLHAPPARAEDRPSLVSVQGVFLPKCCFSAPVANLSKYVPP